MGIVVSVIMAVYDEPKEYVIKAVNSLFKQSYKDLEIIVVSDNPNNKDLNEFLNTMKGIHFHVNQRNIGLAGSLNKAFEYSIGKVIARMDADDISRKDRIKNELQYLENNKLDFVTADIDMMDEKGTLITSTNRLPKNFKEFSKRIKYGNCLVHPTYMFTREMFKKIGGYNENLLVAQDYEFAFRAYSCGVKIGFLNEKVLIYRVRESSVSKKKQILQQYVVYFTQCIYRNKEKRSFDDFDLSGQEYKLFKKDFEDYFNYSAKQNGIKKMFIQIVFFIKSQYVRNMLINGLAQLIFTNMH